MELISLQGRETESFKVHRRAIDAKPPLKVFYLKISRTGEPLFRRRKVVKGSLTFRGHPWLSRDFAGLRIVRSIGKKF